MNERLTPPVPGEPLSVSRITQLYNAVRSLRIRTTPPLRHTQGPDGTTLSISLTQAAAARLLPQAWDLSIDGNIAKCVNCLVMRSAVTVTAAGVISGQ